MIRVRYKYGRFNIGLSLNEYVKCNIPLNRKLTFSLEPWYSDRQNMRRPTPASRIGWPDIGRVWYDHVAKFHDISQISEIPRNSVSGQFQKRTRSCEPQDFINVLTREACQPQFSFKNFARITIRYISRIREIRNYKPYNFSKIVHNCVQYFIRARCVNEILDGWGERHIVYPPKHGEMRERMWDWPLALYRETQNVTLIRA